MRIWWAVALVAACTSKQPPPAPAPAVAPGDRLWLDALVAHEQGFRVLVGGDGCAQPSPAGSVSISGGSGGSAAGGSAPSSASPSSR